MLALPEVKTIDVDGPLVFREWDGPPETTFLLLHGLGGAHINWVRVAPGLSGLGRVIAIDLPGFGRSTLGDRSARLMDQRRTVGGAMDALGIERAVLAGNSMGGVVAMLEASIEPARVEGVVLTSSALPFVKGTMPHPIVLGGIAIVGLPWVDEAAVSVRLRRVPPERLVRTGLRFVCADPSAVPEDVVQLHIEMAEYVRQAPGVERAFLQAARSLVSLGRRQEVSDRIMDGVRSPVLLLHGRRDRFVPAHYAEAALAHYPAWRGRFFPDVGHVPQLEAPGRWVSEVADWFASLSR